MNYNIISGNEGLYTVELEHRGNLYRSEIISEDELCILNDATDNDMRRLLDALCFYCIDDAKLFF
jgi:hypothetical protein